MRRIRILTPVSVLAAALLACGASPKSGESVGSQGQPIIAGTAVTADAIGTLAFTTPGSPGVNQFCSGTVIDGHWLLTAHHCVTVESVVTGGTALAPSDIVFLPNFFQPPSVVGVFLHPTLDVALLKLSGDFVNPATNLPYPAQLYSGDASSLVGHTVVCQGWGDNTLNSGSGTLRTANLPILQMDGTSYRIGPNSQGQIDGHGDSGGSCYLNSQIVGVQSTCVFSGSTVGYCDQVAVENFYSWASELINLPSDCTFLDATAQCVQGWQFEPGANVVAERYVATCSEPLTLTLFSGEVQALNNDCDVGGTRTQPGNCSAPTPNAFIVGWQDDGVAQGGNWIGSVNPAIACDSAGRCSQPFNITIPNCDTPVDTFTASASSLSVAVNGEASTLLTWTGPWVQEDWGLYDTFSVSPTIEGLTWSLADLTSPNAPGTYTEYGPNYGQGYLSVSAATGTPLGSYAVTVDVIDQASGVDHALPVQLTVTACVPSVTCSASSCGTLASDDGCGHGPVVCGSCGTGESCSDNVCCRTGDTWNAASQECRPTCSVATPYCALTGTCLSVISCEDAGGGTGGGGGCTPLMAARHECS